MLNTGASVGVLTLLLGLTGAMAQTAPPAQRPAPTTPPAATETPKAPVAGQIVVQETNTVLAKQDLIGQAVHAPDNAKIGSISDLILSQDGKNVEGFVIGVGGFLGLGEKSVALKLDKLKMIRGADGVELFMDMTKDELRNTPSFKSQKDVNAEKQAAERARNQLPPQRPRIKRPPMEVFTALSASQRSASFLRSKSGSCILTVPGNLPQVDCLVSQDVDGYL